MNKIKVNFFLALLIFLSAFTKGLPEANQKVVEYVQSVMGTQVGTGECTDLLMGAQFYIRNVRPSKKSKSIKILPGDFISFNGVVMGGLSFPEHYAIIIEVESETNFIIAHQNHNGRRSVSQLSIDLKKITQGKYHISRPK